jgi:hypothetical protein
MRGMSARGALWLLVAWWGWAAVAAAQEAPAMPAPEGERLRAVVVDAATYGIDPVVGQHVTLRMRETARAMGYEVVDGPGTLQAAQRVGMAYPPSPADLWRVTYGAGAARGAFARVWAQSGRYMVEVTVASLDGGGPFVARTESGAEDLHDAVARATREALPDPSVWDAERARELLQPEPAPSETAAEWPEPSEPVGGPDLPVRAVPARRDLTPLYRFELALQTEAVFGTGSDRFYNHLLGARIGWRINEDLILSAYAGYANLRGRGNRANNLLPYLQIEHRVRTGDRPLNIPLRLGIGYLPFNGPVVRMAVGLNFPFGERFEVGLDLLAPTFWVLPDRTAVSLNLAAELVVRL